MSDEYTKYLEDLHAKASVPGELLQQIVREGTGKSLKSANRIIAGEANEVYGVICDDDSSVIVRISRIEENEFEREVWALEQVRRLGVQVPEMISIKDYSHGEKILHTCIQKRIIGDPLERGAIDYRKMSQEELHPLIVEAGALLSKIHSVACKGFGYLDSNGEGDQESFKERMSEHLDQYDVYHEIALRVGMNIEKLNIVFDVLKKRASSVHATTSVLNHGDFGPKHIMVSSGKVTGILDWGQMQGDLPHGDFARWDFWFDDVPIEWLMEGYEDKTLFEEDFWETTLWISLNNALGTLYYYDQQKYSEGTKIVQYKIDKILARL